MSSRDGAIATVVVLRTTGTGAADAGAPAVMFAGPDSRAGSFNWTSLAVSCTWSGCAATDGPGRTAANEALALMAMLRMSSEENSANRIATAAATRTLARILEEIDSRLDLRRGIPNSS